MCEQVLPSNLRPGCVAPRPHVDRQSCFLRGVINSLSCAQREARAAACLAHLAACQPLRGNPQLRLPVPYAPAVHRSRVSLEPRVRKRAACPLRDCAAPAGGRLLAGHPSLTLPRLQGWEVHRLRCFWGPGNPSVRLFQAVAHRHRFQQQQNPQAVVPRLGRCSCSARL